MIAKHPILNQSPRTHQLLFGFCSEHWPLSRALNSFEFPSQKKARSHSPCLPFSQNTGIIQILKSIRTLHPLLWSHLTLPSFQNPSMEVSRSHGPQSANSSISSVVVYYSLCLLVLIENWLFPEASLPLQPSSTFMQPWGLEILRMSSLVLVYVSRPLLLLYP